VPLKPFHQLERTSFTLDGSCVENASPVAISATNLAFSALIFADNARFW
jgi:hypothetical protein